MNYIFLKLFIDRPRMRLAAVACRAFCSRLMLAHEAKQSSSTGGSRTTMNADDDDHASLLSSGGTDSVKSSTSVHLTNVIKHISFIHCYSTCVCVLTVATSVVSIGAMAST